MIKIFCLFSKEIGYIYSNAVNLGHFSSKITEAVIKIVADSFLFSHLNDFSANCCSARFSIQMGHLIIIIIDSFLCAVAVHY